VRIYTLVNIFEETEFFRKTRFLQYRWVFGHLPSLADEEGQVDSVQWIVCQGLWTVGGGVFIAADWKKAIEVLWTS
jgi:hypothetical protein